MKKWVILTCLSLISTLSAETKIVAFAGSTRVDSYNKKLVLEAAKMASKMGASVTIVDLKECPLPFYDADLEASQGMPSNAKWIRNLFLESEGIIIATPVYNASIPAVLKNVLDWVSRGANGGRSRDAFQNKKFAIMSAGTGRSGGAAGLPHLIDIIADQKGRIMPTQVSLPGAYSAFDANGGLINGAIKKQLEKEIKELIFTK